MAPIFGKIIVKAEPTDKDLSLGDTVIHVVIKVVEVRRHLAVGELVRVDLAALEVHPAVLVDPAVVAVDPRQGPLRRADVINGPLELVHPVAPPACRRESIVGCRCAAELEPPVLVVVAVSAEDAAQHLSRRALEGKRFVIVGVEIISTSHVNSRCQRDHKGQRKPA